MNYKDLARCTYNNLSFVKRVMAKYKKTGELLRYNSNRNKHQEKIDPQNKPKLTNMILER
jgi:hypothetical protein